MRTKLMVLSLAICSAMAAIPAAAQVSVGIGLPGVSIGINVPTYPQLVAIPGYPVYYAPNLGSNYFFYDGAYWVYQNDNWYSSTWYNGPWGLVQPAYVPAYVLRVPVRYYRSPPVYFRGWRADAPPRWGDHWGHDWERNHAGWDRWNRSAVPAPAPLPAYQRQYSGNHYPHYDQQQSLHGQYYRYQHRDETVRRTYPQQGLASTPTPQFQQSTPGQPHYRNQPAQGQPQQAYVRPQPPAPGQPQHQPGQVQPQVQHQPGQAQVQQPQMQQSQQKAQAAKPNRGAGGKEAGQD